MAQNIRNLMSQMSHNFPKVLEPLYPFFQNTFDFGARGTHLSDILALQNAADEETEYGNEHAQRAERCILDAGMKELFGVWMKTHTEKSQNFTKDLSNALR